MRKINLDELKKIQTSILRYVDEFCLKHNIQYWIDGGTLLGAIRHNGYIPWDDDIDLGMLRDDYDKFLYLFNKLQNKYIFKDYEIDKTYLLPHGKVFDNKTILYEPDENGIKMAVNIDVVVYDNAPDNDFLLSKQYFFRNILRTLNIIRQYKAINVKKWYKVPLFYILHFFTLIFPVDFFNKMIIANSKKYLKMPTKRVGNFMSYSKIAANKQIFSTFTEHIFEGHMYKIPIGYDEWLREFYGNYMELPPIEKRKSHHDFVAFYVD